MKLSEMLIPSQFSLPKEGRLLLAFSGGEDSLYLLYLLSILAKDRAVALYVNHNIRAKEELVRELEQNKKNASILDIPLVIKTIEEGLLKRLAKSDKCGLEAAARKERYKILFSYAEENGFDYILTAHHEDDQVETLLMRMLSSAPFWAWGGIRERDGILFRPLLRVAKSEIKKAIKELGLTASEDSTNCDISYKRNFIRKKILPLISSEEKRVLSKIALNVASLSSTSSQFIVNNPLFVSFSPSLFLSLPPWEKERLLYSLFNRLGERERISRRYLNEIDNSIERGRGRVENKNYIFYITHDEVKAYRKIAFFQRPFLFEETILPCSLYVSNGNSSLLNLSIERDILENSIIRRNKEGDSIILKDGKRKISSLLKEKKIPYAIVIEKNGEIIAFFSSFLGGRDRISSSLIGKKGYTLTLAFKE